MKESDYHILQIPFFAVLAASTSIDTDLCEALWRTKNAAELVHGGARTKPDLTLFLLDLPPALLDGLLDIPRRAVALNTDHFLSAFELTCCVRTCAFKYFSWNDL